MVFIDEAKLHVRAGRGGDGCVAFRREKYVPRGGPAGGDGGEGGSVVFVGDRSLSTLFHLRHRRHVTAERGRHGEGSNRTGRSGADVRVPVPPGTLVVDDDSGEPLGEILADDEEIVVARGGRGGRGNARFATPTRQAPDFAEEGQGGEERRIRLELKLLADIGLVGLPNAGKSTFLGVVSAARPKVADYPFTTLEPQLGVVALDAERPPFVIADLPGLIAGAARGVGLGLDFLKHVERCRVLVQMIDLSTPGQSDPAAEVAILEREMEAFDPRLLERRRLLVGSKLDAASSERSARLRRLARERETEYYEISSVTGEGLDALLEHLAAILAASESDGS